QILLLVGGVLLGLEAFRAAVPGRPARSLATILGWSALVLGLGGMMRAPVHSAWTLDAFLEVGWPCIWRALVAGSIPRIRPLASPRCTLGPVDRLAGCLASWDAPRATSGRHPRRGGHVGAGLPGAPDVLPDRRTAALERFPP